jgi:hypothetical protein
MKASAGIAVVAASLVVAIGFAAPALGSGGTHYTVHCADGHGTSVVAKAFDSRTIDRAGGKAHALELFKQQHPNGQCWVSGPHLNK